MRCKAYIAVAALVLVSVLASTAQETKDPAKVAISFTTPADAGMPIWMSLPHADSQYVRYPANWNPTAFGCVQIVVRQGNTIITPTTFPSTSGGLVCGWLGVPGTAEGRLPLHLQYPNLEPGKYEVRYERYYPDFQTREKKILEQSEWTSLEVHRATPAQLESWLSGMLAHVPDSAGELLGDYLPSLLASHTERALNAVMQQMLNKNDDVAHYATYSLLFFDRDEVGRALLRSVEQHGPTQALADTLTVLGNGNDLSAIANKLAAATAAFMDSPDPHKLAGATHFAWTIGFFKLDDGTRAKLAEGWEKARDRALAQRNDSAAHDVLMWLGTQKTARAHEDVWRFVNAHLAEEQALICVSWFHDPADLPKLTKILTSPAEGDPHGMSRAGVVGDMGHEYGAASRPYMRQILTDSHQDFVRTAAAQQLVSMNDVAGYQFFRSMIDNHPFYYDEMVRWLKDQFPEIRSAGRQGMADFLERKIRESSNGQTSSAGRRGEN